MHELVLNNVRFTMTSQDRPLVRIREALLIITLNYFLISFLKIMQNLNYFINGAQEFVMQYWLILPQRSETVVSFVLLCILQLVLFCIIYILKMMIFFLNLTC